MKAIRIIEDEHRSLTAIIEALRQVAAGIEAGRMAPDFALLDAMFRYIEMFPERLHHPKEDAFLFARLRLRRPDAAPLLDRLQAEHVEGRDRFADLEAALEAYRHDPSQLAVLRERVERYARFHWQHLRREEDEMLPMAIDALTPDDWATIDAAFASNEDPIVGIAASREFRTLFRRIVALAPPPLGVGPDVGAKA